MQTFALHPKPTQSPGQSDEEYAAEMTAAGYKRVVMWVPDTSRPEVDAEIRRQCVALGEYERQWRAEHPEADENDPYAPWDTPSPFKKKQ